MSDKKKELNKLDKVMMAVTFAEAGEAEIATDILNKKEKLQEKRNEEQNENRPELRA